MSPPARRSDHCAVLTFFCLLIAWPAHGQLGINPKDAPYNAKGDGETAACTITAGSAVLTCADGPFSAHDVGKVIAVYDVGAKATTAGGDPIVEPLSTRIAAFNDAARVTLAATASTSANGNICCASAAGRDCLPYVSCKANPDCSAYYGADGFGNCARGVYAVWGSDDQRAMQQAVDAAAAARGGLVTIPCGRYLLNPGLSLPCAEIGTTSYGTCTKAYNDIKIVGAGHCTILEGWNIDPSHCGFLCGTSLEPGKNGAGGGALIAIGDSGEYPGYPNAPQSVVRNVEVANLMLRDVKHPVTNHFPLAAGGENIKVHDTHISGWSYECVAGAPNHAYFFDNVVESCNKGGRAVSGGGALNWNANYYEAKRNVLYADGNWCAEVGSHDVLFEGNTCVCRYPQGVAWGSIGSGGAGVWNLTFKNNYVKNCATVAHVENGIGSLSSVHFIGNVFDHSNDIQFLSGREQNNAGQVKGEADPYIHGTSIIADNQWYDSGPLLTIGSQYPQQGLEAIVFRNNTATYHHNSCIGGTNSGATCESISDCNGSPCGVSTAIRINAVGGGPIWRPAKAYVADPVGVSNATGTLATPTIDNGHYYRCTVSGTSGSNEPTWPTNGSAVTDGSVTWRDQGVRPWITIDGFRMVGRSSVIRSNDSGMIVFANGPFNRHTVRILDTAATFDWTIEDNATLAALNGVRIHEGVPANQVYSDAAIVRGGPTNATSQCPSSAFSECYATPLGIGFTKGTRVENVLPTPPTSHTVVRAGAAVPQWAATTAYAFAACVVPASDSGHFYCAKTAGTSGGTEPAFPIATGQTVADGTIVWKESGAAALFRQLP